MAIYKKSYSGKDIITTFCSRKEKQGRGKYADRVFTAYVGYFEMGGRVYKVSLNPQQVDKGDKTGYYITLVKTDFNANRGNRL